MTNARTNDDQKINGIKVSYEEIKFILDYIEENRVDLAIWLNKSVSERGPGASIPQGVSARLSKMGGLARKLEIEYWPPGAKCSSSTRKYAPPFLVLALVLAQTIMLEASRKILLLFIIDSMRYLVQRMLYSNLLQWMLMFIIPFQSPIVFLQMYWWPLLKASSENEGQERIPSSLSPRAVADPSLASHMVSFSDFEESDQNSQSHFENDENENEDEDVVEESEHEDESRQEPTTS
ncbi:hypothetical protein BX666DRAFT_1976303 [Dichotomocladium elegans]|nr:hypothetical protein BX666DRAFT_1976303 [Dichotomocladium elegans]